MKRCNIPASDLTMKNNPDEREQHVRPISAKIDQKLENGGTHEGTATESTAI